MKIKIILCVCLAVCLTALGVSGFMLYNDYAQRQNDQNAFEQLDEVTRATNDEAVPDETTLPTTTESTTFDADTAAKVDEQDFVHLAGETYRNHAHDFKSLREINSECIGWLSIYGTTIDYPVMHTPSNPEKYLNLNFTGGFAEKIVQMSDGFTGADLESTVRDLAYRSIANKDFVLNAENIVTAFNNVVPLSQTSPEKIEAIRDWGKERAVPASGKPIGGEGLNQNKTGPRTRKVLV